MKDLKIGIVTHYYKSTNYGGNLQAFALCKVLNKLGYSAEQIQYEHKVNTKKQLKKLPVKVFLKKIYNRIYNIIKSKLFSKKLFQF
jgi:hypothetical protein